MRLNHAITFLLVILAIELLPAQQVTIHGTDSSYAGASIRVTIPGNPFIHDPAFEERLVCGDDGSFTVSLDLKTGRMVQLETGIYQATLYVEPGTTLEVKLPPFRGQDYADRISPFSQSFRIPLRVLGDPNNVNNGLYRFDSLFFPVNEQLILSSRQRRKTDVDSLINELESDFEHNPSPFFHDYRKYKYGVLKLNEGQTGLESISKDYLGPEIKEAHPGFMELFSAMFKDFLFYYSNTPEGRGLRTTINRTYPIDSIRNIIARHPAVWNDTLADMVLLLELSSVFYRGDFHKEAILILLDSMAAYPVSPTMAVYAGQLRDELASLVIGHSPPDFNLQGTDGQIYAPGDFKGKYLFLLFCTPDHYGCMMEFPFLKSFHSKHSEYLEVVTVMVAEEFQQVKEFMTRNGYPWKALYYDGRTDLLEEYRVRAFPTAYLIGRDGNMLLSPGTLPSEGFEQHLFRIMRSRGEI
jgi:hypothetical protein